MVIISTSAVLVSIQAVSPLSILAAAAAAAGAAAAAASAAGLASSAKAGANTATPTSSIGSSAAAPTIRRDGFMFQLSLLWVTALRYRFRRCGYEPHVRDP